MAVSSRSNTASKPLLGKRILTLITVHERIMYHLPAYVKSQPEHNLPPLPQKQEQIDLHLLAYDATLNVLIAPFIQASAFHELVQVAGCNQYSQGLIKGCLQNFYGLQCPMLVFNLPNTLLRSHHIGVCLPSGQEHLHKAQQQSCCCC
jgi:hypothetical protein